MFVGNTSYGHGKYIQKCGKILTTVTKKKGVQMVRPQSNCQCDTKTNPLHSIIWNTFRLSFSGWYFLFTHFMNLMPFHCHWSNQSKYVCLYAEEKNRLASQLKMNDFNRFQLRKLKIASNSTETNRFQSLFVRQLFKLFSNFSSTDIDFDAQFKRLNRF